MLTKMAVYIQYLLPQRLLSIFMGCLAESRLPWLKNFFIFSYIKYYKIDMTQALIENPRDYPTFNHFFIRQLKPHLRPIAPEPQAIASPTDGTITQIGYLHQNKLLQAKNKTFDLKTLLGNDVTLAEDFYDGAFATFYLAPHNYHRVHMPVSGTLDKTIYVPGKLFSVNQMTSLTIPNLYGRNERLISVFHTPAGTMAVILVGAMIVGSIQMVWMQQPIRGDKIMTETTQRKIVLDKGAELGHFQLGSTVIVLFEKNKIRWLPSVGSNSNIKMGSIVGERASAGDKMTNRSP